MPLSQKWILNMSFLRTDKYNIHVDIKNLCRKYSFNLIYKHLNYLSIKSSPLRWAFYLHQQRCEDGRVVGGYMIMYIHHQLTIRL